MGQKPAKIEIVETLRGVAALSVLLFHWTVCVPGFVTQPFLRAVYEKLDIGVYIFFAVSGFVIPLALDRGHYRLNDLGRFVAKRMIRLDPPFVLSIAFCLLIAHLATLHPLYHGVPFSIDITNLLLHLFYLCPFFGQSWVQGGIYWTLGIEFQYYLFAGLIFPLITSPSRVTSSIVLTIFAALCFVDDSCRFRFILPYTPFFAMGIVTFLFVSTRLQETEYLVVLSILASLCLIRFEVHQAVGGIGACLLMAFYRKTRPPLLGIGAISYSLYLFHFPIALKVVNYSMHFSWGPKWNWLIVILGCLVCVGLAWLIYLVVERPTQSLAAQVRYGSNQKRQITCAAAAHWQHGAKTQPGEHQCPSA